MSSSRALLCASALCISLPAAFAQGNGAASLNKPLSEGGLLNGMEALGGDTPRRSPLTIGEGAGKSGDKKDDKDKAPRKGPTEITSREATFDQRTRQAVFLRDVEVKDVELNIKCDKLTAILKAEKAGAKAETPTPGGKPATPPPPTATPAPGAGKSKGSGLEKAIAEGNVFIVQEKVEADGTISRSVGKAKRAEYESATGDVKLFGSPEVQQGINTVVATEEGTVLTLNREGRMRADGPTKVIIKDSSLDKQR